MIGKDLLKTIIVDGQSQTLPVVWERTLKIPLNSGKIVTLAGVRRSGKTYHLFELMRQLQKRRVLRERIFYINFEDERLDFTTSELDLILQCYRELYPKIDLSTCYFFFDEIQEVGKWEKFIARLYNTVSKHIFITGSNASLLSKEIATELRGRTVTYEVFPLSFSEFTSVVNPKLSRFRSADKARFLVLFEKFLNQGGFPELIGKDEQLRGKILQEYFNVMVLRDLIEKYQISQASILKYFCKRVVANSAGEFSVNKIYNELKSQGYQVSKDTLYSYQGFTETIYLSRFIPKFSYSVVKTEMSQKKSYVIDQGMGAALDFKLSADRGRLLETTVALELLKQGKQIAYQQNDSECDFVVVERGKVVDVVQVAADFSDEETRSREIKGLVRAANEFGLKKGVVLVFDGALELAERGIKIQVLPAWQYFLEI